MRKQDSIYIAGHRGMVGSAINRALVQEAYESIITATRQEVDLLNQLAVRSFFDRNDIDYVIIAAAKVGGINANMSSPAQFIYENLMIQNNLIHEAYLKGVKKVVLLGSSCIYPRECPQPMKEEYLLTGKLEPTNESYALAKIAGLKMMEAYYKQYGLKGLSIMPCNLYGPNDSFDLQNSHVLSALVKRFVDAKEDDKPDVTLWGTGIAKREFMHVDDLAKAVVFLLENYQSPELINVGWGEDLTIKELAEMIAEQVGYSGEIKWDATKPDGMPRKCMDVSKMKTIGFSPSITLLKGVTEMINIYKDLKVTTY